MLNRAALILRYREPAVQWINEVDPYDTPEVAPEEANEETTVYLISEKDAEGPEALARWLKQNYEEIFESELESWYTDPSLWPQDRTLELFRAWFDVVCHTTLVDTVGGEIFDDEQ